MKARTRTSPHSNKVSGEVSGTDVNLAITYTACLGCIAVRQRSTENEWQPLSCVRYAGVMEEIGACIMTIVIVRVTFVGFFVVHVIQD